MEHARSHDGCERAFCSDLFCGSESDMFCPIARYSCNRAIIALEVDAAEEELRYDQSG